MANSKPAAEFVANPSVHSSMVECAICLNTWSNPVELKPCGHIFCQECLGDLEICAECRAPIENKEKPNRVILNILDGIQGRCSVCGWTGTREQFFTTHINHCSGVPEVEPADQIAAAFGFSETPGASSAKSSPPPAGSSATSPSGAQSGDIGSPTFPLYAPVPHVSPPQQQQQQQQPPAAQQSSLVQPQPLMPVRGDSDTRMASSDRFRVPSDMFGDVPPWEEYGMEENQYNESMGFFVSIAENELSNGVPVEGGVGEAGTPGQRVSIVGIRRFLMWMNLPWEESVTSSLFALFDEPLKGGLTFHQVAIGTQASTRDPKREYDLDADVYGLALMQFRTMDEGQKGYLSEEEALALASMLKQRPVEGSEWMSMLESIRRKQQATANYPKGVVLHDLLVLCASERDGWDVCDLDETDRKRDAEPSPSAAPAASATMTRQRSQTQGSFSASRDNRTSQVAPQHQQQQRQQPQPQQAMPYHQPPPQHPQQQQPYSYQQRPAVPPGQYPPGPQQQHYPPGPPGYQQTPYQPAPGYAPHPQPGHQPQPGQYGYAGHPQQMPSHVQRQQHSQFVAHQQQTQRRNRASSHTSKNKKGGCTHQ